MNVAADVLKHLSLHESVCAIVVAYHPDQAFAHRLEAIRTQVAQVVVVDNGSGGPEAPLGLAVVASQGFDVIKNQSNRGVGEALDQGLAWAIQRDHSFALTLDQDSRPAEGMVAALLEAYRSHPRKERLAIVAPQVVGDEVGVRARYLRRLAPGLYRRTSCSGDVLDDVTSVITSGSLVNLAAYQVIGGFREDFFIDYVDTEYCLRAQTHGYCIAVACKAVLHHRLGARLHTRLAGLDFYPTFHSPERWYYIARNRIPMIRMYAWRFPHWFTYEVIASVHGLLRMLLFEDRRREKLIAVMKGTIDGLLGRLGPGPLGAR